ncbi:MAG: hypothetical protein ACRD5L_09995 [Bryobacteraceae bacterium]
MIKRIGPIVASAMLASCAAFAQAPPPAQSASRTSSSATPSAARTSQAGAAASANAAAQTAPATLQLAAGTVFEVELSKSLDVRKCVIGDPVTARTTAAVMSGDSVLLPKGATVLGHITEVKAMEHGDATSRLGILFESAVLKNGQEIPLLVAIQAIAASHSAFSAGADSADGMAMSSTPAMSGAAGGGGGIGLLGGVGSRADSAVVSTAHVPVAAAASSMAVGGVGPIVPARHVDAGLTSATQGVIGLEGISLNSAASNQTRGSLVLGAGRNVQLHSGTRLLLCAQAPGAD